MTESTSPAAVIERQIQELDGILKDASKDLNTIRGSERIAAWKKRTAPLIAQHVGQKEAQQFLRTTPGPSFTPDLLEELGDEVEHYRNFLTALAKRLKPPRPG